MSANFLKTVTVSADRLDFILPSEMEGCVVVVFVGGDDDPETVSVMAYEPFMGHDAISRAQAWAEQHVAPYDNQWTILPLASRRMYDRLDHLRAMVTDSERADFGEEWTPSRVAAFYDGHSRIPGRITAADGEMLLRTLAEQGVMVRLGRRMAWAVKRDVR